MSDPGQGGSDKKRKAEPASGGTPQKKSKTSKTSPDPLPGPSSIAPEFRARIRLASNLFATTPPTPRHTTKLDQPPVDIADPLPGPSSITPEFRARIRLVSNLLATKLARTPPTPRPTTKLDQPPVDIAQYIVPYDIWVNFGISPPPSPTLPGPTPPVLPTTTMTTTRIPIRVRYVPLEECIRDAPADESDKTSESASECAPKDPCNP